MDDTVDLPDRSGEGKALMRQASALRGQVFQYFQRRFTKGEPHDAEDLTQQTYLRLTQSEFMQWGAVPNLRGFVFLTAFRIGLDWARARRRDSLHFCASASAGIAAENMADVEQMTCENANRLQTMERSQRVLDSLPPRARLIFALHKLQGLRIREIAIRLRIGSATVKRDLSSALAALAGAANDDDGGVASHDKK
jgi:RNA polymerase sigma factor (sigma-70 family)